MFQSHDIMDNTYDKKVYHNISPFKSKKILHHEVQHLII